MSIVLPGKDQNQQYQRQKMHAKLAETYDSIMPAIKELLAMSPAAGVDFEKLKGAFLIVGHGFDQAQALINGRELNAPPEEKKEVVDHGRKQ